MEANLNEVHHHGQNYTDYLNRNVLSNFEFHEINDDVTKKIIHELKSSRSSGHDGLNSELLKLISNDISNALTIIVNQSIKSGIFPTKLKIAKVTPIYKKGCKKLQTNYRPISVLPTISKILERVISDQLTQYFYDHKLFSEQQYGYRKNSSTEIAALELIDRLVRQLDQRDIPINFYLDLSKAFDCINHKILATKLKHYGIRGVALNLISNYLLDRYQYVQIDDTVSQMRPLIKGVPQGSILGPLLFNVFTYDIIESSTKFNFIMYADDTTLNSTLKSFGDVTNLESLQHNISTELNNVVRWRDLNKLRLNVLKTKYMLFHMPQKVIPHLSFTIQDNVIDFVNSFNFLGITFDCHLTWKSHIRNLSIKLSRISGILHSLRNMFPVVILQKLYVSLVCPQLTYGLLAWGSKCDLLITQQKRCLRSSNGKSRTAHTETLLKTMNQLKLVDMYNSKLLKFYYKLYRNQLPCYFDSFLPTYGTSHYPLRYDGLHLPHANHKFCEVNAKYQLHKLLRAISHPLYAKERVFLIREEDTAIEVKILNMSPHQFSMFVKMAFVDSYRVDCNLVNCINNYNR